MENLFNKLAYAFKPASRPASSPPERIEEKVFLNIKKTLFLEHLKVKYASDIIFGLHNFPDAELIRHSLRGKNEIIELEADFLVDTRNGDISEFEFEFNLFINNLEK